MITVTKLPDSTYLATYEVVNAAGYAFANASPVFFEKSPDGLNWGTTTSLGTPVERADGRGIGSSPTVTWVPTGGPKGMVVVASKWGLDAAGNLNFGDSTVTFSVKVATAGTYTMNVRYANGTSGTSSHSVSVNGGTASSISYPKTADWGRYLWAQKSVSLNAGTNTIRFGYSGTFAELDQIQISPSSTTPAPEFRIVNRNSGKLLEIFSAATTDGAPAGQWGPTGNPTQVWQVTPAASGTFQLVNKNSGKLLEIPSASTADGTDAAQWGPTGHATQRWSLTPNSSGYWAITNANSGKYLEIDACSTADGAVAQQWGPTSGLCQQWGLVKEGIQ